MIDIGNGITLTPQVATDDDDDDDDDDGILKGDAPRRIGPEAPNCPGGYYIQETKARFVGCTDKRAQCTLHLNHLG